MSSGTNPFVAARAAIKHCGWRKGSEDELYQMRQGDWPKLCLGQAMGVVFDMNNQPWDTNPERRQKFEDALLFLAEHIEEQYEERLYHVGKFGQTWTDMESEPMDVVTSFNDHPDTTYEEVMALLDQVAEDWE